MWPRCNTWWRCPHAKMFVGVSVPPAPPVPPPAVCMCALTITLKWLRGVCMYALTVELTWVCPHFSQMMQHPWAFQPESHSSCSPMAPSGYCNIYIHSLHNSTLGCEMTGAANSSTSTFSKSRRVRWCTYTVVDIQSYTQTQNLLPSTTYIPSSFSWLRKLGRVFSLLSSTIPPLNAACWEVDPLTQLAFGWLDQAVCMC